MKYARMRNLALALGLLSAGAMAQTSENNRQMLFNHADVGITLGSMGIGIDLAMPITEWVRVRAGYSFMPISKIRTNFPIESANGPLDQSSLQKLIDKQGKIDHYLEKYGLDINDPKLSAYKEAFDLFQGVEMKDHVKMDLKPNLHQFKFMVDVMPLPNNRHWSVTAGFFAGSDRIGSSINASGETQLLRAVTAYNNIYTLFCMHDDFGGHGAIPEIEDPVRKNGITGIYLGHFDNGDKAYLVPEKEGKVQAHMSDVWKVRPYVGLGYNTHLSRNRRWKLSADAGIMFMGGRPKVLLNNVYRIESPINIPQEWRDNFIAEDLEDYRDIVRPKLDGTGYEVYNKPLQGIDLMNDLHDVPGKVGKMAKAARTLTTCYPNLSVTFSYRLF